MAAILTAGDALLQAILDEPEADDLRLIYADWLEDRAWTCDRERAALIRWQVETGNVLEQSHESRRWTKKGGRRGKAPAGAFAAANHLSSWWMGGRVVVERGFLQTVGCACRCWLTYGPKLVRQHPVERVELTDREPMEVRGSSAGTQFWFMRESYVVSGSLAADYPRSILPDAVCPEHGPGRSSYFSSMREAIDDLSQACLRWARETQP